MQHAAKNLFFPFKKQKCNGFTLVELLVAMTLGAFFLSGLLQIFFSIQQAYRLQENLATLEQNGRDTLDTISQDVRMAGFWGCSKDSPNAGSLDNPATSNNKFFYKFDKSIEGFEGIDTGVWNPVLDESFTNNSEILVDKSDVLTIRKANHNGFTIESHAEPTLPLQLHEKVSLDDLRQAGIAVDSTKQVGNVALVVKQGCLDATVFRVTDLTIGTPIKISHDISPPNKDYFVPGNLTNDFNNKTYPKGKVYALNTISYYVGLNENKRKTLFRRATGSANDPSITLKNFINSQEPLAEGVEELLVLYGVDTDPQPDGAANYYVRASQINNNWDKVVSIRVKLLMSTESEHLTKKNTYTFNGKKNISAPLDGKIRREFVTTIALRNRLT